jgi:hypothetical protein
MKSTQSSIFTFDHGQKKLNKAIGVEESYLDDLQETVGNVLKDHLFDEDRNMKDDLSPSLLVEACLTEFSYSQLVLMSSFFLQHKLEDFCKTVENKIEGIKKSVKKIAIDEDDVPPHIKQILMDLMKDGKGDTKDSAINGDDLPQEVKDFLDSIVRDREENGDDDDED